LFTFGVGSVVELPNLSVMVMGLDDWPAEYGGEGGEDRLLRAGAKEVGSPGEKMLTPPGPAGSTGGGAFGDPAALRRPLGPAPPRGRLSPSAPLRAPLQSGLFELKLAPHRGDRPRSVPRNCTKLGKPPTAVPARFLVACENGHLDDFPWVEFAHAGPTNCKARL